jgi:hypothetical protein
MKEIKIIAQKFGRINTELKLTSTRLYGPDQQSVTAMYLPLSTLRKAFKKNDVNPRVYAYWTECVGKDNTGMGIHIWKFTRSIGCVSFTPKEWAKLRRLVNKPKGGK